MSFFTRFTSYSITDVPAAPQIQPYAFGTEEQSSKELVRPRTRRPAHFFQRFSSLAQIFSEMFGLDVRSLALFRIGLGVLLLTDLLQRSLDLRAHYTDFGLLPRGVFLSQFSNEWFLSLHLLGGTTASQAALFLAAALCALALLVGYRTQLAVCLSFIFLISLHNRNPFICDGGDVILHVLLFWAMFLPLGITYSYDSLNVSSSRTLSPHYISVATIALLLQICFVYWFAYLLKSDPIWREEGSAVYYALNLDSFTAPFGLWVRQFPAILPVLTHATLILEGFGPCLLFIPVYRGLLRVAAVGLFIGFHIGLGLCMALGIFPWIAIVAWLSLLPTWVWETLGVPRDFSRVHKEKLQAWLRPFSRQRAQSVMSTMLHRTTWAPLREGFCFACLAYTLLWNLRTINSSYYSHVLPASTNWFGYTLRLDQTWDMFAPRPASDDGWYVIPAHLRNGAEVNLMTGESVTWEKPAIVSATYRNQRWRKYLRNIWERTFSTQRPYFAQFLCRSWNEQHTRDLQVETFNIYYMKEETLPEGKIAPPEPTLLWAQRCFER